VVRIGLRSEEQSQEADDEYGLFAGMTYEPDRGEADKIDEEVDRNMAARRRARSCANTSDVGLCCRSTSAFHRGSGKKQNDRSFSNSLLVSSEASLQY